MKNNISYKILSLLITSISIIISNTQALDSNSDSPLTFGVLVCLSGPCALSGQNALNGVTLAVEDLNHQGGILGHSVKFVVEDSQDAISGSKAVLGYQRLRRDKKISFIIGPSWTPGLLGVAPIASKDKDVIVITYEGGIREFHESGNSLFNARGVDETTTRRLAQIAYSEGAKTASIIGSQQAWELAQSGFFEDEFKKIGGKVLFRSDPVPTLDSLMAEMSKLVIQKPAVILMAAYTQSDLALKALKALEYTGKIYMAFIDDSRIRLSGDAIEGAITLNSINLSEEFHSRLLKTYPQTEVLWTASTAYDTTMIFAEAMKRANSIEADEVRKAIDGIHLKDAVSGELWFEGSNLVKRKGENLLKVKEGKLIPYIARNE